MLAIEFNIRTVLFLFCSHSNGCVNELWIIYTVWAKWFIFALSKSEPGSLEGLRRVTSTQFDELRTFLPKNRKTNHRFYCYIVGSNGVRVFMMESFICLTFFQLRQGTLPVWETLTP